MKAKRPSKRVRLQERDHDVLASVLESHCLATSQIASLHFPSQKKASERLKVLVESGYLRKERHAWSWTAARNEYFYYATPQSKAVLAASGVTFISQTPCQASVSANFAHLASVNQFSVLLVDACRSNGDTQCEFIRSWGYPRKQRRGTPHGQRRQAQMLGNSLRPDAVVLIHNTGDRSLLGFLEMDLASEPLRRRQRSQLSSLETKMSLYCSYFDCEEYKEDCRSLFAPTVHGFRVLLVTKGARRIDGLREKTAALGDTRFVWATTIEDLDERGVFGTCWQIVHPGETARYSIIEHYDHPEAPSDGAP